MKKYELVKDPILLPLPEGTRVFRIRALKDFPLCNGGNVFKGQLGGCISDYYNLSQEGNCWVDYDALVLDSARVEENGLLLDSAIAKGEAIVEGNAIVSGNACIMDNATVKEHAVISDEASIKEYAIVSNFAKVSGSAMVSGDTVVTGSANISGHAIVKNSAASDSAIISDFAIISDNAEIYGTVKGHARISDSAVVCIDSVVDGNAVLNGPIDVKKGAFVRNSVFESRCLFDGCKYNFSVPPIKTNKNTKVLVAPIYPKTPKSPIDKPSLAVFIDGCNIINIALTHEASATDEGCSRFFSDFDSLLRYLKTEFLALSSISEPVEDKRISSVFNWLKNEDFSIIPLVASNFFNELVLLSDDRGIKGMLYFKRVFLCELLSLYLYAQIAGIYLYGIEMFSSEFSESDFSKEHSGYVSFINKLVNAADMDLSSQEISLSRSTIVFNEHMVNAVKKACDFSDYWKSDILTKISEIDEVPLLELYSE